jgi:hypothetical protein
MHLQPVARLNAELPGGLVICFWCLLLHLLLQMKGGSCLFPAKRSGSECGVFQDKPENHRPEKQNDLPKSDPAPGVRSGAKQDTLVQETNYKQATHSQNNTVKE